MSTHPSTNAALASLIIFMLLLSGCGTTPPSKFYMLQPIAENATKQTSGKPRNEVHIGIGPIQFAKYLDRTQIITRTNNTQVNLAETHRWAEPLQHNFARTLAENLSMLVSTDKVTLHPSRNWPEIDYQVLVNVWQFDASRQGEVTLVANWSIRGKSGSELLAMKTSVFRINIQPEASYTDIVHALSKTVYMLSNEITNVINEKQNQAVAFQS